MTDKIPLPQVRHLEAIIRISEAFCKMRLSEYCTSQDVDRAIAVTVDSFVGAQKVSCKKALSRAFAKYVIYPYLYPPWILELQRFLGKGGVMMMAFVDDGQVYIEPRRQVSKPES